MRLNRLSITVATLLAMSAVPASAEFPGRYGVRAGVNLSAFAGSFGDLVEPDQRVAANVAFVYEHDFVSWLALHTGLGYSAKGGVSHSEGTDPFGNPTGTSKDTWSFNYLEVPLLLRGRLQAFGTSHVFAELGPMLDFRLNGKFTSENGGGRELSLTDEMNVFDLGVGAGVGIEFPAGPGRLGVETRYTRGLDDLYDVSGTLTTINQAWTFALSYTR
jgi:hypothetical protein